MDGIYNVVQNLINAFVVPQDDLFKAVRTIPHKISSYWFALEANESISMRLMNALFSQCLRCQCERLRSNTKRLRLGSTPAARTTFIRVYLFAESFRNTRIIILAGPRDQV